MMPQPLTNSQNRRQPRSCQTCYQRKVRCDRGVPCTSCSRYGTPCVYSSKTTSVESKDASLQSISSRLDRMEVLLSFLIESQQGVTGSATTHDTKNSQNQDLTLSGTDTSPTGRSSRPMSSRGSCKPTWDLLLNEDRALPRETNLATDISSQEVS